MSKFTVSRHVPYTAEQVFAIARDVARYREFLPLTKQSTVYNQKPLAGGAEQFDADLMITYAKLNISETLESRVTADPAARTVRATADNKGPMRHLDALWRIEPAAAGGSSIILEIDYTLKSRTLQFLLSGMLDLVMRKVLSAFEERARTLYGVSA